MKPTSKVANLKATPASMGWRSLSAFEFVQICSWGTLYYAFPQIAVAMNTESHWSKFNAYGALTVGLLISTIAAISVGIAIDKGYGRSLY